MSGKQTLYVLGAHALVALACIIAAAILTGLGDLDPGTFGVVVGAAIGLAGGVGASNSTLQQAVNGKSVVSNEVAQTQQRTLQLAVRQAGVGATPPEGNPVIHVEPHGD